MDQIIIIKPLFGTRYWILVSESSHVTIVLIVLFYHPEVGAGCAAINEFKSCVIHSVESYNLSTRTSNFAQTFFYISLLQRWIVHNISIEIHACSFSFVICFINGILFFISVTSSLVVCTCSIREFILCLATVEERPSDSFSWCIEILISIEDVTAILAETLAFNLVLHFLLISK